MTPSSDMRANVIRSSLLEYTVATDVLTSAHPLLLNRKHNLHSVCKRRHNLHTVCETKHNLHLITYIKFIQKLNIYTHSNLYTYTDQFIHQVQQKLNNWHLGVAARDLLLLGCLILCLSQSLC
jgi:hypothetical protein